jgi:hypothetical protein
MKTGSAEYVDGEFFPLVAFVSVWVASEFGLKPHLNDPVADKMFVWSTTSVDR